MAKTNSSAATNQAKQAAQRRENRVQEEASKQLLAFAPVFANGTPMKTTHFVEQAFVMAEAFVAACESRDAALEASFDPRVEQAPESTSPAATEPSPSDDGADSKAITPATSA